MTDSGTSRLDVRGVELATCLGENNAPRACADCSASAAFYVLDSEGDVSRFTCSTHLADALRSAGWEERDRHHRNGKRGIPLPTDKCEVCDRRRDELPPERRLYVEIGGGESPEWLCERCRERGRGLS